MKPKQSKKSFKQATQAEVKDTDIYKFQRSQFSSDGSIKCLIYNQDRSFMKEMDCPEVFWAWFDKYGEKFYATGFKIGDEPTFVEEKILPKHKQPAW